MKKLILSELLLLFLATTFMTDAPPPGWYQQTLPVNDQINDIYFLDSLTGWVVTAGASSSSDTGYIMKTTNGGNNWIIQYNSIMNFNVIQFVDNNTGYAGGGDGLAKLFKTVNGGINWNIISSFGFITIKDLSFINSDAGWICDDNPLNGGIFKTTNGGTNWTQQAGPSYRPKKLFFINADTGWMISNEANSKLYRTINGGVNWSLIFTYNTNPVSFYFINSMVGWTGGAGTGNGIQYTTNSGFNWINSQGYTGGGYDVKFLNDSIGYTGRVPQVLKSTDGGKTWGYQNTPLNTYQSIALIKNDTSLAWAGYFTLIHTTDGGGPIIFTGIQLISTEIPNNFILYQNYPNPFNPATKIKFDISKSSFIEMKVYDIQGKQVSTIVSENLPAGEYETEFSADGLASGVYFYSMFADGKLCDTKKMVLLK